MSEVKTVDDALVPKLAQSVREWAHHCEFGPVESPYDGVEYPDLVVDIPKWIEVCLRCAIADALDVHYNTIKIGAQFFRLTTETTPPAPHGAHNDAIHGKYSAFYYVNEAPDGVIAGTSLLRHRATGLNSQPASVYEWELWHRDTNEYNAWHIDELVKWKPNRLAIYPAERMHRAEPPGGWGQDATDGRLVLITFFSC